MKKYLYILMICIPFLISCNDWLIEEPKSVAAETFYNTVDEASAAVLAPLAKYRTGFNMSYPGLMECFADYQYGRGSWASNSDYAGLDTQNQSRATMVWEALYGSIRDCNIALHRLPSASAMTEEQINSFLGELRFIRALSYFYLVRHWDGVPLRTESNMDQWEMGKSSAEQIYELIIEDLNFAITNCPENQRLIGTPHKNAAKSLLGHVYLQLKDYSKAMSHFKEVIDSNKYSLVSITTPREFEKVFGPVLTSSEEIFSLKNTPTQGWEFVMFASHPNARIEGKPMHPAGGWFGIYTLSTNPIINEWDNADLRKKYNLLKLDFGIGDNTFLSVKFYDTETPSGSANSNPIIRYADVLLMYAEAATMAAGVPTGDSLEKLNMVKRRAYGYDPSTPSEIDYNLSDIVTKDSFIDLIIKEQAYENYNEAKRWPFLVRLDIAKDQIKKIKGIDVSNKHLLFPIPITEFTYNKGMDASRDQNPGY